MSKEFKRENRYLVLKCKDIDKWLTAEKRESLYAIAKQIADEREAADPWKPSFECVVVESDWSIYEQVWALVQQEAESK